MHRVPHRACTRDIPWLHRGGYRRLQRRYVSTEYRNVPCPANLSVAQRMGFERETFRIRLLTSFRRILTGTFWKLETTVFIKCVKRCAGSRENPDKAVQPVSTRGWDSYIPVHSLSSRKLSLSSIRQVYTGINQSDKAMHRYS